MVGRIEKKSVGKEKVVGIVADNFRKALIFDRKYHESVKKEAWKGTKIPDLTIEQKEIIRSELLLRDLYRTLGDESVDRNPLLEHLLNQVKTPEEVNELSMKLMEHVRYKARKSGVPKDAETTSIIKNLREAGLDHDKLMLSSWMHITDPELRDKAMDDWMNRIQELQY